MDIYIHGYLICLLLFLFRSETACHPLGKRPCEMQAFSQELYGLTDPLPLSSWALQGHLMRWVLPAPFHRIWDVNQKIFYLRNNQLVAGYLQGPNTKLEEKIDVVPIEPHTMFLGIHGGKLCLACVKSGDEIKLKLEAVNITDLNQNREQDKRFAFIRFDNGPTTSFESAACPGWFLCTSLEADQPVGLTNMPTEALKVTKFYFQQD
ncbi:interleukin-1 receptor antagonist protein isoform X2 [Bubalus bubalis]|uniref:interleukin-1 receptor antagonist protein isoform X2 n=2 Tax=Bubalus bubalis TaxID=89462 RepID=UPI000DBCA709|nr:interleukin-1 receptor antagonist protein isoform X2 [Bubalus bubalis]